MGVTKSMYNGTIFGWRVCYLQLMWEARGSRDPGHNHKGVIRHRHVVLA